MNTGFGSDDAGQQSYGDDSGDHRTSATVVNATTVRGLPLNGRSWTDLATIQPVNAIHSQASRLALIEAVGFRTALPSRWVAVVVSPISAGICEETGLRGYMQRPIEQRHGAPVAILIPSLFAALHLTKAWATPGMVPIVFGTGVPLDSPGPTDRAFPA